MYAITEFFQARALFKTLAFLSIGGIQLLDNAPVYAQKTPDCTEIQRSKELSLALNTLLESTLKQIAFQTRAQKMTLNGIQIYSSDSVSSTGYLAACRVSFYGLISGPNGVVQNIPYIVGIAAAYDKDGQLQVEVVDAH